MTSEWCVSNRVKRAASRCPLYPRASDVAGVPGGSGRGLSQKCSCTSCTLVAKFLYNIRQCWPGKEE